MPMEKITLRPGIDTQKTRLLNEGGWSDCNLIRFREGLPEVYGGWVAFLSDLVDGVCRGLHAWTTLAGRNTLGIGTSEKLYVSQDFQLDDVTPILQSTMPTNAFTTVSGSDVVTINDPGLTIPVTANSFLEISGGAAVGGLTLSGAYQVALVANSTTYTITAAATATSSATGGGAATIQYLLPAGLQDGQPGAGYGVGPYGVGGFGTPRATSLGIIPPQVWTIDNFGENMIACPRGEGIFVWAASGGVNQRATRIPNAPLECNAIFVSNVAQQVIALGAVPAAGGAFDPMLVAWCDNGNYETWLAASSNAAGSFPLTQGSQLLWGGAAGGQNLLWTDTALYGMLLVGSALVYGFQLLGTNCGIICSQGAAIVGNRAYWMSGLNFMWYNGTVQELPCTVRDRVYKSLNRTQAGKIVCGTNTQFSEIRWDFPSLGSIENDSYVIYNYRENTWTLGGNAAGISVARTAWVDYTAFGYPIGFDDSGASYSHEQQYSAAGQALPWFLQSGDIDIANGEEIMFCDAMIPDQILTGGSVGISISARRYPNNPAKITPEMPFQVTPSSSWLSFRIRGRQLAIRFDNSFNVVGQFWRLGALRARTAPDGRN